MKELFRALAIMVEPPGVETARVAELLGLGSAPEPWEHTELFVEQLVPHASVYLGPEGKLGGEAGDRVAGFWRALGQPPPEGADHLAALLGLWARLEELEAEAGDAQRGSAWRRARAALLHEHVLSWSGPWLVRLRELAAPVYREWGRLLGRALVEAAGPSDRPPPLPLHLREAPLLEPPEEIGGEAFLEQLLAPVRTGMILTRSDLARAAVDLGLGLRIGERRWVLTSFLQQAPGPTLGWLAGEAARQGASLVPTPADPVAGFWRDRADRTARLLRRAGDATRSEG